MNITIGTGSEAAAAATGLQRIASDDEIGPFTSLMRLIFKNILMHICLILGLMGNILTLIVLLEKRMRRASTTQYLAALTLFDSLYLIGSFINNIQLNYPNTKESNLIPFFNLLFLPLTDFSGNTSAYLILMFTIERYLAVAYPLKSRYWCHPSRARKIIGITIFFCFLFTFPTFLESKIEIRWETTVNRTVVELTETNIYPHYYTFVYFWFISVTFQIIPLTLLIILNSILMKYIHKSMTSKKQCTSFETTQEITTANNNDKNKKKNFIVKKFKKFPTENLSEAKTINDNQTDRSRRSSFDMNANTNNNEVKKNRQPNIQLRCNAVNQQSEQNKATLLLVATVLVFLGLFFNKLKKNLILF
jgi:hypothetical protein